MAPNKAATSCSKTRKRDSSRGTAPLEYRREETEVKGSRRSAALAVELLADAHITRSCQTTRIGQRVAAGPYRSQGRLQGLLTDKVARLSARWTSRTQHVALRVEGVEGSVIETGLYNLTNDKVPVLVHFGADRQEARTLIRLQSPEDQSQGQ